MIIFIIFALFIALASTAIVIMPLWRDTMLRHRSKIVRSLIFILLILMIGFGLYGVLGAPMIVLFTA